MIIDSHQHFWNYEPKKHEWIDDSMKVIRRDFLPEELQKLYKENSIDGCVAVQADQTLRETNFLIQLSEDYDFIKGIVGWVDLRSNAVEQDLERYTHFKSVKGFRHVVQGEPDPNFVLRPDFTKGIFALHKYNFTYDILVFPHQLGSVLELVSLFGNQKFVIDHIAKPYIKDGFFDGWALLMKEIAKHENVYCKMSGMITEADFNTWAPEQIHPYMDVVLEAFGPERVMFGSDWPVCLVAGNYGQVKGLVTDFISKLSPDEQAVIMGKNAVDFYNLK
ncbi:amidohydrolase family protein [Seonamhaeicola maritimus]|uniref:Amidohydrolase family protein n=1 Tax=Seonamhaeicola maritimus TaxID=2591822 RepID=A0A5C7GJ81_9FLAO|nr:amidohydrolase family protein [Seonamhaeicola maritimus]TXG38428.1 amidohydrolase family protein [Seonamhaeicola maritimus]